MERAFDTPFGRLTVVATDDAITKLAWRDGDAEDTPLLREAEAQVLAYCAGARETFDLPLQVNGSDFQRAVCAAMSAIPFGETRQYGDLARDLGVPAQAIGQACGGNPIPIIIPCHRVLGASGLGGFSGGTGIETKVQLLRLEGAASLLI
ncbi:methylated-DNA--[protein]-cysteine S-methyltransferase [Pacificoceanicola onchidii]|uniref:methylated-DNA--[protein]-cysteine S-methyltransferase n=1 Tax=Pacificoceanicola onchidii TaxID=2562685 RepID=UPI0010A5D28E|nr:methylated-DNA--[protein]-cysteine S-methyltransferase [Pacificoceanicola onchidii]